MADILGNLPDNLIDVILMDLPCKDAVRTCILSKKWRYDWLRLKKLTLDDSLRKTKKDLLNPTVKFAKIINQILTLHQGPITKVTLKVVHPESCTEIENFICFLSRNDIQHLVLHFPFGEIYKLSSSLFTCSRLRHLDLHHCSIHPPSAFQGFDDLISLELREVTISSKLLESLISHCPLLEQLVLEISGDNFRTIEIDAPMLRLFDFTGDTSCISLVNVPRLVKVTLLGDDMYPDDLDFATIFEACPALEHLSFSFLNYGFIAEEGYEGPRRLPFNLNSVKRLYLPGILLEESYKLECAFCLLCSIPYLEYLEIQVFHEDNSDIEESPEFDFFSDVTFNHLGEVKLENFTGRYSEMQLIKLFLANSPVLKKMMIDRQFLDRESLGTRLEIFSELSSFSRASPEAEIVYIDLSKEV